MPRSIQHWPSVRCDTVWFLSQWLHSSALFCDFNSLHPLICLTPQPWWWLVIWKVTRLKNLTTSRLTAKQQTILLRKWCPTLTVLTVKKRGKTNTARRSSKNSIYKPLSINYKKSPPLLLFYLIFLSKFLEDEKNIIAAKNQKIISLFEEETWITTWLLT